MNEFSVGDKIIIDKYGWAPEEHIFHGRTGTIIDMGEYYFHVILYTPVLSGYGTADNPALISSFEMTKVDK